MVEKLASNSQDVPLDYTPILTRVHDIKWKALTVFDLFKGNYDYPIYSDNKLNSYLVELNFTWDTQMLASLLLKDWINVCDVFKKRIEGSYKYFSRVHCITDFLDTFSEPQIHSHIFFFYLLLWAWEVDHIPNTWRNLFMYKWQYYLYDLECLIPIGVIDGDSWNWMSVTEICEDMTDHYIDFFEKTPSARFCEKELRVKTRHFLQYWLNDIVLSKAQFYRYAQSSWIPDTEILDMWDMFLESILGLSDRVDHFIETFSQYWV